MTPPGRADGHWPGPGPGPGEPLGPELTLVRERRVQELLPQARGRVLEASGVLVDDGQLYVIFDNTPDIAVLSPELDPAGDNRLIVQDPTLRTGYEDIARDPVSGHRYVLIEALPRGDGWQAVVEEFDPDFGHLGSSWLDFALPSVNKGLEGLTCLQRDGETYLLGLCEGNLCLSGKQGRVPGGGRIQVFRRGGPGGRQGGRRHWRQVATLRLPASLMFVDYSSLAVRGDEITVVSQQSSALWVGRLEPDRWEIADAGATYSFPRRPDGEVVYRTVEGVSWLGPRRVVTVSDKDDKDDKDDGERAGAPTDKEQMVHLFDLPV
jgi:hypothetical protein